MNLKLCCFGQSRKCCHYPNKMFAFTIPYFILNFLDLIITRIALATSDNLYELNPLYYYPYFPHVKILVPILLFALYVFLYCSNETKYGRKAVGKAGLYSIITLMVLSWIVCVNNVYQWAIVL